MTAIGIFFCFIGLGCLFRLMCALTVHALPVLVGINAGFAAWRNGAGEMGGIVVGLIAGVLIFNAGRMAISATGWPVLRMAVLLLFAVPAAGIGYVTTLYVAQSGVPSVVWQQVFAVLGAAVAGSASLTRMMLPDPPDDDGWDTAWP